LTRGLPSTLSADGFLPFFECFIGTTPRSDSSATCTRAVRPKPSPVGPPRDGHLRGLPVLVQKVSRRVWGLRLRRTVRELALPLPSVLPSAQSDSVGVLMGVFRSSIPSPPLPLLYASRHASRHTAQNSGPSGSLLLSREEFSSPAFRRFIPAPGCWSLHLALAPCMDCSMLDTWLSLLYTDCSVFHTECPVLHADRSVFSTLRLAPPTDCSVLGYLAFAPISRLLCSRHLAFRAEYGLLRSPHFPPCASHRLLGAQHFTPRTGPRLLCARIPGARTGRELLRVRYLAIHADHGLLRVLHLAPGVNHGLLRA